MVVNARQNIFGRLNYDYLSKHMLEFTLRHDGSMNFANDTRWGYFLAYQLVEIK